MGEDGAFENDPIGEALGGEVWEVESCVYVNGFESDARVDVGRKLGGGKWAEFRKFP